MLIGVTTTCDPGVQTSVVQPLAYPGVRPDRRSQPRFTMQIVQPAIYPGSARRDLIET